MAALNASGGGGAYFFEYFDYMVVIHLIELAIFLCR